MSICSENALCSKADVVNGKLDANNYIIIKVAMSQSFISDHLKHILESVLCAR